MSFYKAKFTRSLDASRARFDQVGDFRQVVFGGPLRLTGAAFDKGVDLTGARYAGFENACARDRKKHWATENEYDLIVTTADRPVSADTDEADELFGDYETAFRKLKLAAETERDTRTAQRMHRYEQIARRHRRKEVGQTEKLFSHLYGWVADYGEAIVTPLVVGSVLLPLVFGAGYLLIACPLGIEPPPETARLPARLINGLDAFSLAFTNTVRPFMVWNPEAIGAWEGNGVLNALREDLGDGERGHMHLGVRLLSTLQSLLTLPCFFLSALALRRRFQLD